MQIRHHKLPDFVQAFAIAEARFRLMIEKPVEFDALFLQGAAFTGLKQAEQALTLFNSPVSLFTEQFFSAIMSGGEGFKTGPVSFAWRCLIQNNFVAPAGAIGSTPLAAHFTVNKPLIAHHLACDTFANIFAPASNLVARYAEAIVAVDVDKNGNLHRGTAFIIRGGAGPILVTAKHNIDAEDGVEVKEIRTARGTILSPAQWHLEADRDLAYAPLSSVADGPVFRLDIQEAETFEEMYTIGYPNIPHANAAVVGHRGELNGNTILYASHCPVLLISNLVSPGNSGGPVLSRTGFCAGMVFQSLEAEYATNPTATSDRVRFSAALPASEIRRLLIAKGFDV